MGAVSQTASCDCREWIASARWLAELKDATAAGLTRQGRTERAQSVRRAAYILRRQADRLEAKC